MSNNNINAVTALYAFAGWLTSMDKPITFSSSHWATPAADMVSEIIKLNNIGGECDFDNIKVPSNFSFPIDFDADIPKEFDKPVTSPIYTKSMADNGDRLTIGMKFNHKGKEVKTLAVSDEDGGSVLFQTEGNNIDCCWHNDAWVNPITPPIELIDGECYLFESTTHGGGLGYYDIEHKEFTNISMGISVNHCTNIKLLEVKT